MYTQTTTDLDVIRNRPNRFTWGKVTKIHDIGRYTIVEYTDRDGDTSFHVYVDGKSTSRSAESLDKALVLAMAIANLGGGSGSDAMAIAASKVLGLDEASIEKAGVEAALVVWESVHSLCKSGTPADGIGAIAEGNVTGLKNRKSGLK